MPKPESKELGELVVARLREFFLPQERWFRGLWDVGLVLSIRELLEASQAMSEGVLSEGAVRWLADALRSAAERDTACWAVRGDLLAHVKDVLRFQTHHWYSLVDLADELEETYLAQWAKLLAEPDNPERKKDPLRPERLARALASHLLDLGFSQQMLGEWLRQLQGKGATPQILDVANGLRDLAHVGSIAYRVLVPVSSSLSAEGAPPDWVGAQQVPDLIRSAGLLEPPRVRFGGGWLLEIRRRDQYAAAQAAFDEVDKRSARLLLGRGQHMVARPFAYVFGEVRAVAVTREAVAQPIRIKSIDRADKIFAGKQSSKVDAAFELLAQVDTSSAVAVGAGWAAVESLLADAGQDKVVAATHLANLVACSFPRAELTSLASRQIRSGTTFGKELGSLSTNRERAAIFADRLKADPNPISESWADRAAENRMRAMLDAPKKTLGDIAEHAHRVFRRFYRQRNLVLHGGKTHPIALRASLRTGIPLIAAGVDRIAHAWLVDGVPPASLAVRAQSRISLVERPGRSIVDLVDGLGPDPSGLSE